MSNSCTVNYSNPAKQTWGQQQNQSEPRDPQRVFDRHRKQPAPSKVPKKPKKHGLSSYNSLIYSELHRKFQ